MSDLAPGRRRAPAPFRQATQLAGATIALLGGARLALRDFTTAALAKPLTVRALGATLIVTGAMLLTGARQGATGARRAVGASIAMAIVVVGLLRAIWPADPLPVFGALRWPIDALVVTASGAGIAALSLWRARQ